jgi:peptidyl-prolyl cis-trans isomerase D
MRRVGFAVLAAGIAVAGCGSFRDVFTSHAETAARVGSRELKSARVAEIITKIGGPNANPQAAELVAGIWVDLSLFADRVATGSLKTDSATIARLVWPQVAEQKVSAWHDSILARRSGVTPATADSAYAAGELRLFQHILITAAGVTAADSAKAKASADKVLAQTRTGDFGKLASQYSGDGSRSDNGFLMVSPKGAFVPEFETAAWALAPGGISGVVKSQFGFHIIRRPTVAESRDRFVAKLKEVLTSHADSLYMAALTVNNAIVVKPGAGAAIRGAVADFAAARKSKKELVSTKGGPFTVGEMVKWLDALPAQALGQIKAANDTLLEQFAKTLAQNAILLREADSAKITINPSIYQALVLQYQSQFSNLKQSLGLDSVTFSDSSKTPVDQRRKRAAQQVEHFFDQLLLGLAQFRPVPPTLSAELRTGGDYRIFQAGVSRAVELIVQKRKADSAAAGPGAIPAPPPGGLSRAPGGPPRPAQPADTAKRP